MDGKPGSRGARRPGKAVAVLDIGSSSLRMGIYQRGKEEVRRLELLDSPLRLGHEVFASGRISAETVRELCTALKGCSQVMKEYGVGEYRVLATTALREAENRAYVVDQIKIRNGLTVEVLENGEESAFIYSAMLRSPRLKNHSLLSYIGTGSVGAAVWEDGALTKACHLRLGFLKLSEMLSSLEDQTARFDRVLGQYVDAYFQRLSLRLSGGKFRRLLLTGREAETIASLCGAAKESGGYVLERERVEELFHRARTLSAEAAAQEFGLPQEAAGQLLPLLAIYLKMMEVAGTQRIEAPVLDMLDIVAAQMLVAEEKAFFDQTRSDGALACSRRLGSDNQTDGDHGERVRAFAVQIFDKTKKLHGIPGKRRLLLECAALLHELGYRFNAQNASQTTYDLVRQAYLFGLNEEETRLVAEIARCGDFHQALASPGFLSGKQRLLTDKLAAILILADALDESRRGKITELKVRLEDSRLVVTARGREDLLLEKWAFGECVPYFEEVFGIRPVFVAKSNLI